MLAQARGISLLSLTPWVAMIIIALGNAFFHVGALDWSVTAATHRGLLTGLFFGVGAAGLAVGGLLGGLGYYHAGWASALLLLGLCMLVPTRQLSQALDRRSQICLLVGCSASLILQSMVTMDILFAWKKVPVYLVALIVAMVIGRIVGGALYDHTRWRFFVGTLPVLSALLLPIGIQYPVVGMFCLALLHTNFSYAIIGGIRSFFNHRGLAFGIVSSSILLGSAVLFTPWRGLVQTEITMQCLMVAVGAVGMLTTKYIYDIEA
jgi:predicted MFS family arabinose efflux permease